MCSEAGARAGEEAGSQEEAQLPATSSKQPHFVNVILRRTGAAPGWWHGGSLLTDMRSVKDFGVP